MKAIFVLAAIFIAIAIVAPVAIFAYNGSLNKSNIISEDPNGKVTSGNITMTQGFSSPQGISNIIPVTIGVVFAALFLVTIYYGLREKYN